MKIRDKIEISILEFGEDKVAVEYYFRTGEFLWMGSVIEKTTPEYRQEFEKLMLEQFHQDWNKDGE